MSDIFANVDRMGTGAKVVTVAIGLLIMLAYSLENRSAVQQPPAPPAVSAPSLPPASVPAPSTTPPAQLSPPRAVKRSFPAETKTATLSDRVVAAPAVPEASLVLPAVPPTASTAPVAVVPRATVSESAPEAVSMPTAVSSAAPPGYFTVGSTKDDVLRVQGTPTKGAGEYQWAYGFSWVRFQNGRVAGWNVSPLNPLKAVLVPQDQGDSASARANGFFTVGSTKDQVIGVQGTPSSFSDTRWMYGLSSVDFSAGTVTSWNDSPLNPLRARLLPAAPTDSAAARGRGYFTVGSTKDEVLGVQGTPSRFSDTHWAYGLSSVSFQNGVVTSWNSSPLNPLKAALLPAVPADSTAARNRGYFTVGSTKDEVLGAQGTPTSFSDTHWAYGVSSVSFQNGTVATWNSSPLNPLKAALTPENAGEMASARARGYFVVGSTKDEVLGVQGTPSSFSDTHWSYGLSSVSFQNGRVTRWNSSPLNPLRARKLP